MFSKSSKPLASAPHDAAGGVSTVASDLTVTGNLQSNGDIRVDGRVEGDVACRNLVIGPEARVTGEIKADIVKVAGAVEGQVHARVVELAASARVRGDIHHETLAIEAGAFVEGLCRHVGAAKPISQPEERSLAVAGTA